MTRASQQPMPEGMGLLADKEDVVRKISCLHPRLKGVGFGHVLL